MWYFESTSLLNRSIFGKVYINDNNYCGLMESTIWNRKKYNIKKA